MEARSGSRSERRLKAEAGLEEARTHPGRSVPRWGWSRESPPIRRRDALRCGMWWIPDLPATRLKGHMTGQAWRYSHEKNFPAQPGEIM